MQCPDGSIVGNCCDSQFPFAACVCANRCYLWCTGRVPRTQNLGLEKVGVELGPKGVIKVGPEASLSRRMALGLLPVRESLLLI